MKLPWNTWRRPLLAGSLLAISIILAGCSSSPYDPVFSDAPVGPGMGGSPAGGPETTEVARFHINDTVTVTLDGLPDRVEPHTEAIKEDGTITLASIGHVQAAGKTAGELQNAIHDLYVPKYYRHLAVTVTVGDRVYYVTGEVRQPGRQLYAGQMTVTKAITTVGGFTDFASHRVWLIRANGQRIKVNCDKAFQDPALDPLVYPNDQVQVPRSYW